MLNRVDLIGNVTKEPKIRKNDSYCLAKFTLAVDRDFSTDGKRETDFIECEAWGKTAEHVEKLVNAGAQIAVSGRIVTGKYEKNGATVYTTAVNCEKVYLTGKRDK